MSTSSSVLIGGKNIATDAEMDGGTLVERQRLCIEDPVDVDGRARVTDTTPNANDHGVVVQSEALGAQADAAIDTDAPGSVSGKLRGLVKLLAATIKMAIQATTSGGCTPFTLISAASTNATVVLAQPGQVYAGYATNINAAIRYANLHDTAGTPVVGVAVKWSIGMPGNTAGGGGSIAIPPGLQFTSGVGVTLTTLPAGSVAVAAGEIVLNLAVK